MSRMKHLLRKLHIGGTAADPHHHKPPKPPKPDPPSSLAPVVTAAVTAVPAVAAAVVTEPPSTSRTRVQESDVASSSSGGGGGGGDYSLFEEEYQVQLALAISASDPDGLEDPDSVQIKAAKRISLGCPASVGGGGSGGEDVGGRGGSAGSGGDMEFLSLRYWSYNVVNYDEKLMDGFYDVYGIISTPNVRDKMPSLVDLQAISIFDNIDYEVVLVNRTIDLALQKLEQRATFIASKSKAEQHGIIASGLIQKIADLVVSTMGGPVGDADDITRRWTIKSYELRNSLNTIVLPLGSLEVGLSRHRALLFKVLADRINLPCKLVKGSYYTGSDEGAVNFIKVDYDSEYIVDLMGAPGTLIPTETPSSNIESCSSFLLGPETMEQPVKDLCLALDKVNYQFGRTSEILEGSSGTNLASELGISHLTESSALLEHQLEYVPAGISERSPTECTDVRSAKSFEASGESASQYPSPRDAITPAQQMKVNDVSKYVVTAAKNPEFAQKLHAVLLESGASPPPDLFSDLSPSEDLVEKNMWHGICVDGDETRNEGQSTNLATITPITTHSDVESISSITSGKEQQFSVDRNPLKQAESSRRGKELVNTGKSTSTGTTDNWLVVHNIQVSGSSTGNSWAKCTSPVFDDAKMCRELRNATTTISDEPLLIQSNLESNIRLSDLVPCHQMNASDIPSKHYEGDAVDSTADFIGMEENLQLMVRHDCEQLSSIVDGVAEWEIPWDDLQLGERIGLGSYGEVYRADWNGTEVAVKKFLDQGLSGDALEQFRCEVKIMLRLRHPNVVLFMGAVTRPPNLSILTEFLPRGSLYRLLHRPNVQLDEKRRLQMALDVAKGMNYLHSSHPTIVHRDLKSPNLLVDKSWAVKVCDFGLSRLKHHTFLSSKSTAGTPEWMAPEVLRNEPSNEKCDVYSFGVILWELTTLRMPWGGMNPMQVVGAVGFQNRRLDIPEEVDPAVAKIISDCWETEPSRRPSFQQLLSPLKKLQRLVNTVN